MQTGFQRSVNRFPALGIPGDFASANPHHTLLHGGAGAHVGGPMGVAIGRFAWVDVTGTYINNIGGGYAPGLPIGFVHRVDHIAYLDVPSLTFGETSMVYPGGFELDLMDGGDFWALAPGATTIGMKAFMSTVDGTVLSGAAGATVANAVETGWWIWTVTDGTAGNVMKISKTAVGS